LHIIIIPIFKIVLPASVAFIVYARMITVQTELKVNIADICTTGPQSLSSFRALLLNVSSCLKSTQVDMSLSSQVESSRMCSSRPTWGHF